MTPIVETYPVLIGLITAVALLLVYSALNRFVFQRLREQIFQRERSKIFSKALGEGNTSVAWDTANIDLQLDKLSGRTRHETRLTALQHIETALEESGRKMTRKQINKLIEYLPNQKDPEVRLRAAQLLSDNVDALRVGGDSDQKDQSTEPDLERLYGAWKRALTVWSLELVGLIIVLIILDQLPIQTVVSLTMIAFVIAVIPLFWLASGRRLLLFGLIVLAIMSGALWLYADMTHTGRDSVYAEPLSDSGSHVSVRISYPVWLTADNIDNANRNGKNGGHVVVSVTGGTLTHFAFEPNPLIRIRDSKGELFNVVETTNPEEDFELYLYVVERTALLSTTTTLTPVIQSSVVANPVAAEDLAFQIELEPAAWRSFRDIFRLITGGAGGTSAIWVVIAALLTFVSKQANDQH